MEPICRHLASGGSQRQPRAANQGDCAGSLAMLGPRSARFEDDDGDSPLPRVRERREYAGGLDGGRAVAPGTRVDAVPVPAPSALPRGHRPPSPRPAGNSVNGRLASDSTRYASAQNWQSADRATGSRARGAASPQDRSSQGFLTLRGWDRSFPSTLPWCRLQRRTPI
jgi:hypothetical protein